MRNILQSNTCCVCLRGYTYEKYPTVLPCGHIVCEHCSKQITACPVDRKPFTHKQVKKVFNNASEETDDQKLQGIVDFLTTLVTRKNELISENKLLLTHQEEIIAKLNQDHDAALHDISCLHQNEIKRNAELITQHNEEKLHFASTYEEHEETIKLLEERFDETLATSKHHKNSARGAIRRVAELNEQSKRMVSKGQIAQIRSYYDGVIKDFENKILTQTDEITTMRTNHEDQINELREENQTLSREKDLLENQRVIQVSQLKHQLQVEKLVKTNAEDQLQKVLEENEKLRKNMNEKCGEIQSNKQLLESMFSQIQQGLNRSQPADSTDLALITQRAVRKSNFELGNVIGFGNNKLQRFGTGIVDGNHRKPVFVDSFGTVRFAHPGKETFLIGRNGQLFMSSNSGLMDLEIKASSVTGFASYFLLDEEKKLWSWGSNAKGQLGHNDKVNRDRPQMIKSLCEVPVKQVSASHFYAACVTVAGEVLVWGDLTTIGMPEDLVPSTLCLGPFCPTLQVACGHDHVLILRDDGLWSVGKNDAGQCGTAGPSWRYNRIKHIDPESVQKIECGAKCSAALIKSGQLYVWGGWICGTKGSGTFHPQLVELNNICNISLGKAHILALDELNHLHAWGWNKQGQCGIDSEDEWIEKPTRITGLDDCRILQINACSYTSFIKYNQKSQ